MKRKHQKYIGPVAGGLNPETWRGELLSDNPTSSQMAVIK